MVCICVWIWRTLFWCHMILLSAIFALEYCRWQTCMSITTHWGELLLSETSRELHSQPFTRFWFFWVHFLFVPLFLSLSLSVYLSGSALSLCVFILQCLHLGYITMRPHAVRANTIIGSPKNCRKCAEAALQSFYCTKKINRAVWI